MRSPISLGNIVSLNFNAHKISTDIDASSALLNGGYEVSRSHALGGSLKTTAPRSFVFDMMREWVKTHPVKMENVSVGQIARTLLEKPQQ